MANRGIIIFLGILFTFMSNISWTQYSLGGGISTYHGLNLKSKVNRFGINGFVELPKTNDVVLFIRAAYMFPEKEIDGVDIINKSNSSDTLSADFISKTSYFAVDGGTRHYFINDYDIGFALFAGPHIKGILTSYSENYRIPDGINPDNYVVNPPPKPDGGTAPQKNITNTDPIYSLLFAFGGTVGVKYQLPYKGALMFDLGLEIVTGLYDPARVLGNEISPLSFSFNLGYRFDWY